MVDATVQLTFIGSGDAFGSGGRLQACLALTGQHGTLLLDCGATALTGLKRVGIDPNEVSTVVVTHLHGDHFAGIPFLVLDGQFRRRQGDLLLVGPPGVRGRVEAAMEILFPGSSTVERRFAVRYQELQERTPTHLGPVIVTGFPVVHASGAPPFALRVEIDGKVVGYSGDTEWTDSLVDAADSTDVFVCECYQYDRDVRYHLSYPTLRAQRGRLKCRRLVLTHMSETMLGHGDQLPPDLELAYDGLSLTV
jgi:ribonuclease BN (tRNA processing enzyme)